MSTARRPASQSDVLVLLFAGAAAVACVAAGLGVRLEGGTMGTALSPLVSPWLPRVDAWALLGVPVFVVAVALAPHVLTVRRFPLAVAALATVAGLALNVIPLGPHGWGVVHDLGPDGSFQARNEYLPVLPLIDAYGSGYFLDRFAELVPSLPINVAGHPPGLAVAMHWLGIETHQALTAVCVASVAATAPLTHALARALGVSDDRARVAAVLVALSPGFLLFGISSVDAILAALGMAVAVLLVGRRRALGVLLFGVASTFGWSLLAVGFFAVVVVWRRETFRAALLLAAACGLSVLLVNAALWAASGYDPLGTLAATHEYYGRSLARIRPYEFWWLGSPVAWALSMGVPIAAAWIVAARRGHPVAVALAAVVVIAALAGFTKAETERIWLFLVPLACVGAATVLPTDRLRPVLAALAVQGLAVSFLFQTIW